MIFNHKLRLFLKIEVKRNIITCKQNVSTYFFPAYK